MGRLVRCAVGTTLVSTSAHLFADQPVQQRGLASIGRAYDRCLQRPRVLGLVLRRRQVNHPSGGSCHAVAEQAQRDGLASYDTYSKLSANVPGSWYGRGVRRMRWAGVGGSPSAPDWSTGSRRGGADSTKAARMSRGNCFDRMLMGRRGATTPIAHTEAVR